MAVNANEDRMVVEQHGPAPHLEVMILVTSLNGPHTHYV